MRVCVKIYRIGAGFGFGTYQLELEVCPTMLVSDLKQDICAGTSELCCPGWGGHGVPTELQRVLFAGKELTDDGLKLADCNILDQSTLFLLVLRTHPSSSTRELVHSYQSPWTDGGVATELVELWADRGFAAGELACGREAWVEVWLVFGCNKHALYIPAASTVADLMAEVEAKTLLPANRQVLFPHQRIDGGLTLQHASKQTVLDFAVPEENWPTRVAEKKPHQQNRIPLLFFELRANGSEMCPWLSLLCSRVGLPQGVQKHVQECIGGFVDYDVLYVHDEDLSRVMLMPVMPGTMEGNPMGLHTQIAHALGLSLSEFEVEFRFNMDLRSKVLKFSEFQCGLWADEGDQTLASVIEQLRPRWFTFNQWANSCDTVASISETWSPSLHFGNGSHVHIQRHSN